jgi:hypothetical protein
MTPEGHFTIFDYQGTDASEIISGPDGNLWFNIPGDENRLGKVTPQGEFSYYATGETLATDLTSGPDGDIWFKWRDDQIAKLKPADGNIVAYTIPPQSPGPAQRVFVTALVTGADGNVWVADEGQHRLVRVTPAGDFAFYTLPDADGPQALASGPDGALWYLSSPATDGSQYYLSYPNRVGRMSLDGSVSDVTVPDVTQIGSRIAFDSAGNAWFFAERDELRMVTRCYFQPYDGPSPGFVRLFEGCYSAEEVVGTTKSLDRVNASEFPSASIAFGPITVGGVAYGVLSIALPSGVTIASIDANIDSSPWTGSLLTSNTTTVTFLVSHVFEHAGSVPLRLLIFDVAGDEIVLRQNLSVAPDADGRFLTSLYHDLLGRGVDPTGSLAWLGSLQHGASRQQIVAGVQESPEYRTDLIKNTYQSYLRRTPSQTEINLWLPFFASGGTQEEMKVQILSSLEYARLAGSTVEGVLRAIYRDVLGRPLDALGREWLSLAGNAATLPIALGMIVSSKEAELALVQNYYQQYLGRHADLAGWLEWTQMLTSGGRDETVAAGILGSDEFFLRT